MYFNPTMLENAVTFNLCVWANDNGYPGELLYYSPSEIVQYAEGMYQFVDYEIKPENIVSERISRLTTMVPLLMELGGKDALLGLLLGKQGLILVYAKSLEIN